MLPVIFHEAAEAEAEEAISWFEDNGEGLGTALRDSIEELIDRIRQWPELYPVVYRTDIRGAHTHRFPYSIIYRLEAEAIFVFAVFHQSRNPLIWRGRID